MKPTSVTKKQVLLNELRNMYWAEKHFLKILPKLESAACTRYLKACFKGHLQATQQHVNKLNQVFTLLNGTARGKKSLLVSSVIADTMNVIYYTEKNTLLRDLSLIEAARQMESYEIDKYNRLIEVSEGLGEVEVVALLEEILSDEKEAEETFRAVKTDTLNDEFFKLPSAEVSEETFDEFEAAEEE
jgi:ferritin-like metal-binding protein YciE